MKIDKEKLDRRLNAVDDILAEALDRLGEIRDAVEETGSERELAADPRIVYDLGPRVTEANLNGLLGFFDGMATSIQDVRRRLDAVSGDIKFFN